MEEIKLAVQIREEVGRRNINKVRNAGFLPAIVYGEKRHPTAIKVDKREYEKIMRHHRGESVVFHIDVMEGSKKLRDYSAIVKEEQHDPVTDQILHIDFNRISLKKELEVKVSVEVKGEAVGVKQGGGIADHVLWELDIICLPTNIPQHLEVDITELELGDSIHVKDIILPPGVRTEHDPEATVVSIKAPKQEEELEAGEGEEPEVIGEDGEKDKEGKEEGEGKAEGKEGKKEEPKAEAKEEKKENKKE